ncbi:hypothetical protein HNY73_016494 [Argiope bruennichi]|uniref:Uncharacterized protein n=1 Tax=Argiope bruennichi TaxID=94029 RepID=A0A8T0EIP4_ARGBR|nr:hypothetical protein HNY73_016494 [Argiope bruennichi]
MKTILFTGSPKFLYQEPRRIPTYMAAIIRRHRFVIIAIICIIILIMYSWYFRKEEKFVLNNTPVPYIKETFNDEIRAFDSNKPYFSDMTKITNNIEEKETQFTDLRKFSKDDEMSLLFSKMSKDDSTLEKSEERIYFIPIQETEEFTTEITREIDDEFTLLIGDEETYADTEKQHLETETFLSSKNGIEAYRKHLFLEKSLSLCVPKKV